MNQIVTTAIVLSRINFGEADKIITVLTPDHGKIRIIAKGVRKIKSKLAGGIELFSVSNITVIEGRGEIKTLVSSRLLTNYGHIITDINRTMYGYEALKIINKKTEDNPGEEYFNLLNKVLEALNDNKTSLDIISLWLDIQLLKLGGHVPNLRTDTVGNKLVANINYNFNFDAMAFSPKDQGNFTPQHITLLRLCVGVVSPVSLRHIQGLTDVLPACSQIAKTMLEQFT